MDTSVSGEDSTTIHSPSGVLFASYKPPASSGISGIEELFKLDPSLFKHHSTLEGCRIAVIQDKDKPGEYSWTFVPLPKGKQDIQEEANGWPRPVIVLGYVLHSALNCQDKVLVRNMQGVESHHP